MSEDRRLPLSTVMFNEPTFVPGLKVGVLTHETGGTRWEAGTAIVHGQAWYDPRFNMVVIGDRHYPMDRVHYFVRAKFAMTKKPEPTPFASSDYDYSIGKKKKV